MILEIYAWLLYELCMYRFLWFLDHMFLISCFLIDSWFLDACDRILETLGMRYEWIDVGFELYNIGAVQNQHQFIHISCLRFQEFYHMHQEIKIQFKKQEIKNIWSRNPKIRYIHNSHNNQAYISRITYQESEKTGIRGSDTTVGLCRRPRDWIAQRK